MGARPMVAVTGNVKKSTITNHKPNQLSTNLSYWKWRFYEIQSSRKLKLLRKGPPKCLWLKASILFKKYFELEFALDGWHWREEIDCTHSTIVVHSMITLCLLKIQLYKDWHFMKWLFGCQFSDTKLPCMARGHCSVQNKWNRSAYWKGGLLLRFLGSAMFEYALILWDSAGTCRLLTVCDPALVRINHSDYQFQWHDSTDCRFACMFEVGDNLFNHKVWLCC